MRLRNAGERSGHRANNIVLIFMCIHFIGLPNIVGVSFVLFALFFDKCIGAITFLRHRLAHVPFGDARTRSVNRGGYMPFRAVGSECCPPQPKKKNVQRIMQDRQHAVMVVQYGGTK